MGAQNLVVVKDEIGGTDPYTYLGVLLSFIALLLSLLVPARWVKRLLIVVFGIALLEFVLLIVPMPLWVRVVVGLVLFAAGVVWMVRANNKDHATNQQHTKQIHDVLDRVDTALKNDSPSNLGNSDATIIDKHFPGIAEQVKGWDDLAKDVADSKQALCDRDRVESELRALGADKPPYNFKIICDGLCAITEARTADRAASAQQFPPMVGPESEKPIFTFACSDTARFVFLAFNEATGAKGDLLRLQGSSYPDDAAQFGEVYGKPIYDFLCKMQTWSSTKIHDLKRDKLEKFPKASLERAVKKKRRKTYYRRVQGCPDCN